MIGELSRRGLPILFIKLRRTGEPASALEWNAPNVLIESSKLGTIWVREDEIEIQLCYFGGARVTLEMISSEHLRAARDEAKRLAQVEELNRRTMLREEERSALLEGCRSRGISRLVHFTSTQNLASILKHGLLPRDELECRRQVGTISSVFNDDLRLDEHPDCTSLSITSLNYKLFYTLRDRYPDRAWVLLELPVTLLAEVPCAFYRDNAAGGTSRRIRFEERMGPKALEQLFETKADTKFGSVCRHPELSNSEPTNPQAEVLVRGAVSRDSIREVLFRNRMERSAWVAANGELAGKVVVKEDENAFRQRVDYRQWQAPTKPLGQPPWASEGQEEIPLYPESWFCPDDRGD